MLYVSQHQFFRKKAQKLGKSEKSSQFFRGEKVWNELLSKYMIYVPNVRWIHALKLFSEANGKFDRWKIQKLPKKTQKKKIQNSEKIDMQKSKRKVCIKFHDPRAIGCWDMTAEKFDGWNFFSWGGSQFLVGVLKCINTRSNRKCI